MDPLPQRALGICGVAACVLVASCTPRCRSNYDLSLSDLHGAEGYALVYEVSPASIRITLNSDFGAPPKVVWRADLTGQQRDAFCRFSSHLPIEHLRDSYEPDGFSVADGFKFTFRLRIDDKPLKVVHVDNVSQPQLDPFITLINDVVPAMYRAAAPRASASFPTPLTPGEAAN